MGMSPYAELAFGVDLDWENPLDLGYDDEGEPIIDDINIGEWLIRKEGWKDPYDMIPDEINQGSYENYVAWKEGNPEFNDAVRKWQDRKKELEADCPIELVTYGSSEEYAYILAVKGTHQSASWDGAEPVKSLEVSNHLFVEAVKFCEKHGLPDISDAQWLLTASYG